MNNDQPTSARLRDGTSRQDRLLPALDPGYFQVVEQSTVDLLRFAQAYARQVQFFKEDNTPDGDWSAFLDGDPVEMARYLDDPTAFDYDPVKKERFSRPHFALWLSFLGLLRHTHQDFNTLTRRHLDYYFREVLRLDTRPAVPDHVHLIFTLDKDTPQLLLPAGTVLNAGDDSAQKPLVYVTDQDIVLNQAAVAQLHNLYRDPGNGQLYTGTAPTQITAPPKISPSSSGADPMAQMTRWGCFGSAETGQTAQLGILVASPLLALPEKVDRTVTIKMSFVDNSGFSGLINPPPRIFISTADGMVEQGTDDGVNISLTASSNEIALVIIFKSTAKTLEPLKTPAAVLPFSPWPMIRLVWNDAAPNLSGDLLLKNLNLAVTPANPEGQSSADWTSKKPPVQLFLLHPFGFTGPEHPGDDSSSIPLLPAYLQEGEFYLGIQNLLPSQTLSLLFQLAEGSADPDAPEAQLVWSYLSANQWVTPGEPGKSPPLLLSDDTKGLLQSGIIRFAAPADAGTGSTLMPPGMVWLRAVVSPRNPAERAAPGQLQSTQAVSDILSVQAQALRATFQNNNNADTHFDRPLPPGAITGLADSWPAVAQAIQPYTSFGGRPKEADADYYVRVSERLRHKNRALTLWDYERLTLQNFPEIYKVKCLPAEDSTGVITLVVIPDIRARLPFDPFEPKAPAGVLRQIETFLTALSPPFATIQVKNPVYQTARLGFDVKFLPGFDAGFYAGVLQDELLCYLSPWAFDTGAEMAFDRVIYAGAIAYFIEQRPYVDFLTDLNLYRLDARGQPGPAMQVLAADDPGAIWVSARQHFIRVLETESPDYGIGAMRIEYDFQLAATP